MIGQYVLARRALRDLEGLDPAVRHRAFRALDRFVADPSGVPRRKLRGREDEWRLRVGDWRIRYRPDWDQQVIVVLRVLHRGEAYRD